MAPTILVARVVGAYRRLAIGDRRPQTLVGPLIHEGRRDMVAQPRRACTAAARVIGGDRREVGSPGAYYVAPAGQCRPRAAIVATETFAPILRADDSTRRWP